MHTFHRANSRLASRIFFAIFAFYAHFAFFCFLHRANHESIFADRAQITPLIFNHQTHFFANPALELLLRLHYVKFLRAQGRVSEPSVSEFINLFQFIFQDEDNIHDSESEKIDDEDVELESPTKTESSETEKLASCKNDETQESDTSKENDTKQDDTPKVEAVLIDNDQNVETLEESETGDVVENEKMEEKQDGKQDDEVLKEAEGIETSNLDTETEKETKIDIEEESTEDVEKISKTIEEKSKVEETIEKGIDIPGRKRTNDSETTDDLDATVTQVRNSVH
jgi:hypothetical protein